MQRFTQQYAIQSNELPSNKNRRNKFIQTKQQSYRADRRGTDWRVHGEHVVGKYVGHIFVDGVTAWVSHLTGHQHDKHQEHDIQTQTESNVVHFLLHRPGINQAGLRCATMSKDGCANITGVTTGLRRPTASVNLSPLLNRDPQPQYLNYTELRMYSIARDRNIYPIGVTAFNANLTIRIRRMCSIYSKFTVYFLFTFVNFLGLTVTV